MIDKEFIPHKEALALKELRFNDECFGYYSDFLSIKLIINYKNNFSSEMEKAFNKPIKNPMMIKFHTAAPTYSQAFRWFRENHKHLKFIVQQSAFQGHYGKFFDYVIETVHPVTNGRKNSMSTGGFETYEQAELACLKKLIELIKDKK